MDFETLWSRYRSGTADGEEISQVEAELEKFRLLEAYIEEERPPLPPPRFRTASTSPPAPIPGCSCAAACG